MSDSTRIMEMAEEERPRERLFRGGAAALSDAELLAIFIRTGTRGRNAVTVGRELLKARSGLRGLADCGPRELMKVVKGIGMAKASELAAAFEIGNRLSRARMDRPKADTPAAVCELLGAELRDLRQEVVRVILVDTRLNVLVIEEISRGTLNESTVHPREVFRPALVHSAYGIVVVHNHPSGDPSPSQADHRITKQLVQAAEVLSIRLLDHIVIGRPAPGSTGYFSFREAGVI